MTAIAPWKDVAARLIDIAMGGRRRISSSGVGDG